MEFLYLFMEIHRLQLDFFFAKNFQINRQGSEARIKIAEREVGFVIRRRFEDVRQKSGGPVKNCRVRRSDSLSVMLLKG